MEWLYFEICQESDRSQASYHPALTTVACCLDCRVALQLVPVSLPLPLLWCAVLSCSVVSATP